MTTASRLGKHGSAPVTPGVDGKDVEHAEEEGDFDAKDLRVVFFGVPLHGSKRSQFFVLAATVLTASVLYAAIQERVLYVPGFKYTGWISILSSGTMAACAYLERLCVQEERSRLGSMQEYAKLSVLTMGGMYLTNWSLRYLSYPLRVVFKSCKLIPVMVLSVVYLKKRYNVAQYVSVCLLTLGVVFFALGDAKGKAVFDSRGIVIIMLGSFAEAFAANFEEKRLFNQLGCSTTEVLLYSSIYGFVWAVIADGVKGELLPAVQHSLNHPEVVMLICTSAVAGYVTMNSVLSLIKHFGATVAEIVKSCRKLLTIGISFVVYGKPWTVPHVGGIFLFAASIAVDRYSAGGSSRRFAWLLLGAATLGFPWFALSIPSPSIFSIVIDVGSTGTRLNIFRFDAWTLRILDINGAGQVHVARDSILNRSDIESLLEPLVDKALAVVPPAQRAGTPLAVRANAGLSDVPGLEVPQLLSEVKRFLEPYSFADAGVQLLDGAEEGEYAWLTVNFLKGTFKAGVQAIHEPVVVVDMRSTSLQVAYIMHDSEVQKAKRQHIKRYVKRLNLPYGSGKAHMYRHSYLGYGLAGARAMSLKVQEKAGEDHPCLPTGAELKLRHGSEELYGKGSLNFAECRALAIRLLPKGDCGDDSGTGKCTFAGVWGGPQTPPAQRMVLISYFYDRMHDVGVIPDAAGKEVELTPSNFSAAASLACSAGREGMESAEVRFESLPKDRADWLCFDLTYQAAILTHGFGVPESQSLGVLHRIEYHNQSFEASWALGLAIARHNNQ